MDAEAARAQAVREGLEATGCTVVAIAPDVANLTARVRDSGANVIVCDMDDPSRDALEAMRALNRDEPRPVVLFAERGAPEQISAALEAGVAAYVVEGLSPARVRRVLEVAILRFRAHEALRAELAQARATIEERDRIAKAKRRLMRDEGLSEPEAHRRLQRLAMTRRVGLGQAAAQYLNNI
ncbi:ANTAR domain-containing response regulator [Sabulicella rubraurantiaca]|uniref:ANTAR domain-containing response regulator n=1 Tax=Sabulicella rubraurantiaca TaxID=2811429 RepID=UPI002E282231|nr:ANTAR domain-containing protein [Sabulicella rubraurantiaca]